MNSEGESEKIVDRIVSDTIRCTKGFHLNLVVWSLGIQDPY